jgi:hypothetical protein
MEEKKSFILYADLIHVIEKLDDENAGKLFKHILAYVNDLHPEPENIVIELVFEPIKQQLKRDLKRWAKKKDKQSTAGTVGNLKRWHPDLFEDVENDKLTIEEAISIAKHRVPMTPDRTQSHPIGSIAVNDNVNVNVNVIESSEGKPSTQKTLVERKQKFKEDCFPFIEQYGKPMMTKFFLYWSEHSERGQKMRFEKEKVFDLKLRVATWAAREKEYKKPEAQIDPLVEHVRKMTGK